MKAQKLIALALAALLGTACTAKPQKKESATSSSASPVTKPTPTPSPTPSPSPSPSPSVTPDVPSSALQPLNQALNEQLVEASQAKAKKLKLTATDILNALSVTLKDSKTFVNLTPNEPNQWLELHKAIPQARCASVVKNLKSAFPKPQANLVIASALNPEFWERFCALASSTSIRERFAIRLRAEGSVDTNFAAGESAEAKEPITFDLLAPYYANLQVFEKIQINSASEAKQTEFNNQFIRFAVVLPAVEGLNEWYAWARTLESIRKDILAPLKAMPELPKEQDMKLAQALLGGVDTWLSQMDPILAKAEEAQTSSLKRLLNAVRMDQDSSDERSPSGYSSQAKKAIEALSSHLYAEELLKLDIALAEIPKACSESYRHAKVNVPDTVPLKAFEKMILLQGAQLLESISPGAQALAENSLKDQR